MPSTPSHNESKSKPKAPKEKGANIHSPQLIQQTTANFHTESDLSSLTRISSSISHLRSARQLRLQSQHQALTSLSRKLHHLSQSHNDELQTHDAASHAAQILALDTEKFRIAKGASELEIEGERLSGELRGLRQTLEGLERDGVEGEATRRDDGEDETV